MAILWRTRLARCLRVLALLAVSCVGLAWAIGVRAEEPLAIDVVLKNHRFSPSEIHVPVGKPSVLTIHNNDSTPEEFDSTALKVEKVVVGGTYGIVRLRPLGPGRYTFMGEYHPDTAQGVVIAQ